MNAKEYIAEKFESEYNYLDSSYLENDTSYTYVRGIIGRLRRQADKAVEMTESELKEKALKAFCKAVCPNGIRCSNSSTPYNCKRAYRFESELLK